MVSTSKKPNILLILVDDMGYGDFSRFNNGLSDTPRLDALIEEAVCFRGGMHDYYRWKLEYNDTIKLADGRYLTDLWADEAEAFISRHRTEPFFLHLTFNAPHTPLQTPEQDVRPFVFTSAIGSRRSLP